MEIKFNFELMKSTSLNLFFRIFLPPNGLLLFISILSSCNIGSQKNDRPTIKKHDDSKLIRGSDSLPVPITLNELDSAFIHSNDNSRIIIYCDVLLHKTYIDCSKV